MRLRIFTEPQQGATYDQLLALARLTEELGFDAFFRSDHYFRIGEGSPGAGSTDAWITLAALGRETERIRLGTLVTPVTFRLPGVLAIQVAQADAMSGGRVELGLGAGWYDREHAAFGIPFPPTNDRFEMLEEQLAIIDGMWTTPVGRAFTFEGKHYQLDESPALPKPVQRPRPPIILGGWGTKRTPRLAARFADEFNMPFAPVSYYRDGCDHVARRVREASIVIPPRCASPSRSSRVSVATTPSSSGAPPRSATSPTSLRGQRAGGLPGEVVERIHAFAEAGAETVYLQVLDLDDHDHLRLIAAEVAPHV